MTRRIKWLWLAGSLAVIGALVMAVAAPLSPQSGPLQASGAITGGLGLAVHNATDDDFARMADLGVRYVRMDMAWDWVEKKPGVYDWAALDRKVAAMTAHDIRPVLILSYGNALYSPSNAKGRAFAPVDGRARTAFLAWTRAAATRYRDRNPIWEIWNEPDLNGFWAPRANATDYIALARQTCSAIRTVDAKATVWAPALSSPNEKAAYDSDFMKAVLASDLPRCLSAISVHPYLHWSRVDFSLDYWKRVQAMPSTATRPFVSGETGISNYGRWIQEDTQASYMVRTLLYDHVAGVPVTVWYSWKNRAGNRNDAEDNYGLLDENGRDKTSIKALAHLTSETRGLDRQCLLQTREASFLYAWNRSAPSRTLLIVWRKTWGITSDTSGSVDFQITGRDHHGTDLEGTAATITKAGGTATVSGGRMPYYVRYAGRPPAACA